MNLVLLEPAELCDGAATVRGRRAEHIADIHRAQAGKRLRVGVLGGNIGAATVARASRDEVVLEQIVLDMPPPAPLACTLVLALPRPIVLARLLASIATFGIKRVFLVASARVEKSYWHSPATADEAIRARLVYGLEQGCDTQLPVVEKRQRLRPFIEDELAGIARGSVALVAHPEGGEACPRAAGEHVTLAIGPEGGFVDFEIELMRAAGMRAVTLGERPLRVEQAVAVLVGRLF